MIGIANPGAVLLGARLDAAAAALGVVATRPEYRGVAAAFRPCSEICQDLPDHWIAYVQVEDPEDRAAPPVTISLHVRFRPGTAEVEEWWEGGR